MGQDTHRDDRRSVDRPEGGLPEDVVEDLLSAERCRHVLACLAAREDPVTVEELARGVGARERDASADAIGEGQARDVRDDIYQHHLPKLTATEVVAYDSLVGTVELATSDDRLLAELPGTGQ